MNKTIRYKNSKITMPSLVMILMMCILLTFSGIELRAANTPKSRPYTIILDAGHGGKDHGALDNGAREKDINLGVTKKLASLIKKKLKGVNVIMTRDDDTFVSLQERANIANRNQANLFISIHTNSVDKTNPNRLNLSGTSVYALGPQKDADNLKIAQRENSVIEFEDEYNTTYRGFDPSKDESYIIFEMAQKKNLSESLKFAEKAQNELVKTAGRNDRGVKQAGFLVLWATSMPAVLVELDFICNPNEAKFLTSDEGQEKLAQALFNAVESYVTGSSSATTVNNATKKNNANPAQAAVNKNQTKKVVTTTPKPASPAKSQTEAETTVVKEEILTEEQSDGGTLLTSNRNNKTERTHLASSERKNTSNGPRRRRSDKSRQLSETRNLETGSIQLTQENAYLVKEEEVVKPTQTQTASTDTGNKTKNKKDKKKKDKKDNPKPNSKQETGVTQNKKTNKGRTTFVIKNNRTQTAANTPQNNAPASSDIVVQRPSLTSASENTETVYKILLLSSDKELKTNAPEFFGLAPIEVYKENNQYKYTYGSSKNRKEIEQKLLELKYLLPDATIIVRSE